MYRLEWQITEGQIFRLSPSRPRMNDANRKTNIMRLSLEVDFFTYASYFSTHFMSKQNFHMISLFSSCVDTRIGGLPSHSDKSNPVQLFIAWCDPTIVKPLHYCRSSPVNLSRAVPMFMIQNILADF